MTMTPQTTNAPTANSSPGGAPAGADPRELFARGLAVATDTLTAVRPDQMDLPTPCDELDVRGLIGHLVGVVNRASAIGRGNNPMAVPGTFSCADDAWAGAWADAVADADLAWRDGAALDRTVVLPWATLPGGAALLGYLNEVVVHTWDLARATSQRPTWDDDIVAAAYGAIKHSLPAEGRTAMFDEVMKRMDTSDLPQGLGGPPFGEAVAVGSTANPIDRLVAYTGRTPA